ncbi:class I SAM-dependent methyltransferase [Haloimpatiens massiliensis]|uniref:class I SAM-dependent methyltransferase n=1 Tax=Haloimpatiens massiliensis TaxID=1658110 RepID=UPI000C84E85E|nr:class I SAM-dependent methyltransferase [Haloimpatiens massiliensis]
MNKAKKKAINIWDKVAPNFGEIGPKYWDDFGRKLVKLSNIEIGGKVLDIGMGRGASLFPALEKVGKDGYVVGIDNSNVMVKETHKDISARNICNAEVKNMNAQSMDFAENSFDNVICGFGMGYLLLGENKLNDVLRILKTDGQAAFSIWGVQKEQKWLTDIVEKYLKADLSNSNNKKLDIPKFDNVEDITKILHDSGFQNIKIYEENADVVYMNKKEWWEEMHTNAVRGIFDQIQKLGFESYVQFKVDIFKGLEQFKKDDGLHFNMPVIYAFGHKK